MAEFNIKKTVCENVQKNINPFFEKKLTLNEMESVLDHVNHCDNCAELWYQMYSAMEEKHDSVIAG